MKNNLQITSGESSELSAQEIDSLQHGTWEIDCHRMTLKSRDIKKPIIYSGAGYIKQTEDCQFTFKIFPHGQEQSSNRNTWDASLQAGELIPDHAYYDFTATDYKGREWVSERLLEPDTNRSVTGDIIVEGKLAEISCEGQIPQNVKCNGSSLLFQVFDNFEIPCNERTLKKKSVAGGAQKSMFGSLNVWKFRCCGFDFLIVKEDGDLLKVHVSTDSQSLPDYFAERVIETLQFVLGHPITWEIQYSRLNHSTKCILRSQRLRRTNARFRPPLPPQWLISSKTNKITTIHHRNLFERYLKHVINHGQPRHPLWAQLNAVYEASDAMFIDAHTLTLTVAIESLLSIEFPNLGKPSKKELKAIQAAKEYFENWEGDIGTKNRIKGSIDSLSQPRAGDKMKALVKVNAITKKQWKAWQKIRNASAHAYQNNNLTHQKFINLLAEVEVLFYHLVFHTIGYKGKYMDYSSLGWPLKQYPL